MGSWKTLNAHAKKGCVSNHCACKKAKLSCTSICKCTSCVNKKGHEDELSDSEDSSGSEEDSENE